MTSDDANVVAFHDAGDEWQMNQPSPRPAPVASPPPRLPPPPTPRAGYMGVMSSCLDYDGCAMVVTPVAPQALANRPIVLAPDSQLRLIVEGRVEELALVLDGQERVDLASGDTLDITLGPDWIRLVPDHYDPFVVLRHKLRWSEGPMLESGW
jgi:hypothetical protein